LIPHSYIWIHSYSAGQAFNKSLKPVSHIDEFLWSPTAGFKLHETSFRNLLIQ